MIENHERQTEKLINFHRNSVINFSHHNCRFKNQESSPKKISIIPLNLRHLKAINEHIFRIFIFLLTSNHHKIKSSDAHFDGVAH